MILRQAPNRSNAKGVFSPFITARVGAEKLGVAFTTVQRAIARLERLGIVQQTTAAKRDRVYCAKALLDILEEPAQLVPDST